MASVGHGLLLTLAGASMAVLGCGSTPRDINFGTEAGADYIAPDVSYPSDATDSTTTDVDAATAADAGTDADAATDVAATDPDAASDVAIDVVTDGAADAVAGQ